MRVLAIDPGYEQSALVEYEDGKVLERMILPNKEILAILKAQHVAPIGDVLVIEGIASYGMAVGKTIFETVFWSGRFAQAWPGEFARVYRRDVKMHLCGSMRAKDTNIRQALIDRYGPSKQQAIGLKASPGPLYGFKSDMWAALAVAVTYADANR